MHNVCPKCRTVQDLVEDKVLLDGMGQQRAVTYHCADQVACKRRQMEKRSR
jgi:hypothetical protein